MVAVDHAEGVRLEGSPVRRCCEEGIVGIKNLPGQHLVPLTCETTCVYSFFAVEVNLQNWAVRG